MKRLALVFLSCCIVLCCIAFVAGCGGGDDCCKPPNPPEPTTCEQVAEQLRNSGWDLWIIQEGDPRPTPLVSRDESNPLKADRESWVLARVRAWGGRPAMLIDFRSLDCRECDCILCLRGQFDQEEPTTEGTFQFKYERDQEILPMGFECGRWETTRGIRLTIGDVESSLGDPYSFWVQD